MKLLALLLLAGCATEVDEVYECRCKIVHVNAATHEVDSVRYVVFDTLATHEACQEAGRAFCPTVP